MRVVTKAEVHSSGSGLPAMGLAKRPWFLTILLATGLCIAYLVGVVVSWHDVADRSLYANLGMIPIGLAATLLALSASKTQPNSASQWAWRLLGAGMACFWAGDVIFFIYHNILGTAPFPSIADAGYIAYYPLIFAGVLCIRSRRVGRRRRVALDVGCWLVLGAGVLAISYLLLLTTLQSSRDDLWSYSLAVGYPVGDMFLLAGIAWLLLRRIQGRRWSILLLCAGLIAGLVADISYGYENIRGAFQSGGFPDAAYMVSWALFAWGGFLEVARKHQGRTDRRRTDRANER
jgi:hypothetical protein